MFIAVADCSARRDALEGQLQGHSHHAGANACDPEITFLSYSLHAGAHLRRDSTPRFGDAGVTLVGLAVGGRANTDLQALGKGRRRRNEDGSVGRLCTAAFDSLSASSRMAQTDALRKTGDFVFPSLKVAGRVPLSASIFVADHLRPAAKKAGVQIEDGQRFGLHNLRHSLSNWLVNKAKVEPKTLQGILRHAKIQTTLDLYAQEDGDETWAAQVEYLTALGVGSQLVQ
jgi:integrase-like protein